MHTNYESTFMFVSKNKNPGITNHSRCSYIAEYHDTSKFSFTVLSSLQGDKRHLFSDIHEAILSSKYCINPITSDINTIAICPLGVTFDLWMWPHLTQSSHRCSPNQVVHCALSVISLHLDDTFMQLSSAGSILPWYKYVPRTLSVIWRHPCGLCQQQTPEV